MSRLEEKRTWLGGGAVLAILIVAAGWFGVISPQLSSTAALRDEAHSDQIQNGLLSIKVAKLKKENDKVGQLRISLKAALAGLPFDSGLPAFTRQVSAQATHYKVRLTSIAVGSVTSATVAAAVPTASATTAPTPSASATTTSGTAASTAVVPVAIPITLISTGAAKDQLAFLHAIQVTGPRRALVASTTIGSAASAKGGTTDTASTMTVQLSVFSTPLTAAARAQLENLLSGK